MADDVQFSAGWEALVLDAGRPLVKQAQKAIVDDMLRLVPRDTGELADSIKAYSTTGHRFRIKVGTDHWAPVEYGTRHQAAQPYIRPSVYKKRSL